MRAKTNRKSFLPNEWNESHKSEKICSVSEAAIRRDVAGLPDGIFSNQESLFGYVNFGVSCDGRCWYNL
jgi:hypothetical protein